jgi:hypothetical protein
VQPGSSTVHGGVEKDASCQQIETSVSLAPLIGLVHRHDGSVREVDVVSIVNRDGLLKITVVDVQLLSMLGVSGWLVGHHGSLVSVSKPVRKTMVVLASILPEEKTPYTTDSPSCLRRMSCSDS